MKSQFLIAAPHSGAGKTTISLGIMRALKNRGIQVQPFKCGPDYLDPKLHHIASGQQSINLDRFMMKEEHLRDIYAGYGAAAEVLVTEGVMGLFDGAVKMESSSADIARLLHVPVILVVNARAMAYSAAALLLGFKMLCTEVQLAGVIFNFVSHESHYRILKEAAEDVGITPLGFLPPSPELQIPSRHLGLQTENESLMEEIMEKAATRVEQHIDLDKLLEITTKPLPLFNGCMPPVEKQKRHIAVARDAAFNFIYAENIKALQSLGSVTYFSPLTDTELPEADLIYLPGGYPELHLETLSANHAMKEQLLKYYQNGGKIIAECGGMMYLGDSIADENGIAFPMLGIIPITTTMQHKKLSLGYKRINLNDTQLLGHEFHYSQYHKTPDLNNHVAVWNARNEALQLPVFHEKNLLASYFHFYWGDNITAIESVLFG